MRLLCGLSVLLVGSVGVLRADDSLSGPARVSVNVRMVRVSNMIEQGVVVPPLELDARLEDIKAKLEGLHYRNFKLLSFQSKIVPMERKETLALGAGSTLTVRPLYMKKDRVGMWLKWRDGAGSEVLDTRMHFSSGESMIAGADQSADSGVLLAIDVRPAD